MFDTINEIAVLVTAVLSVAMGSIWYSPLFFGEAWMRATGLSAADLSLSHKQLIGRVVAGIVAGFVFFLALAHAINLGREVGVSIWTIGALLVVLVGSLMVSFVLWEKRPLTYIYIHVGYASVVTFGGLMVLAYWPW